MFCNVAVHWVSMEEYGRSSECACPASVCACLPSDASSPLGRVLLLAYGLGPLPKGLWTGGWPAQAVVLACDVRGVLQHQAVVGAQAQLLGPLQEALDSAAAPLTHAAQPAAHALTHQPATHHCSTTHTHAHKHRDKKGESGFQYFFAWKQTN